ncbi:MAG: sensor histidine kinase [Bacteroidota bacterium]
MPFLFFLTIALAPVALSAPSDGPPTDVDIAMRAGPFDTFEDFAAWYDSTRGPRLPEIGLTPATGPTDEAAYFFVVGADSSIWVQTPTGTMVQMDAYAAWQVGESVSARLGFDEREIEGLGYGYEDGRLYLYLTQSAPVVGAGVVALLLVTGSLWGVYRLWVRLQHAREQGRRLAESRRRLADSREAERLRLAQDLHDGPLQDLQALRMQLGVAARQARRSTAAPDVHPLGTAVEAVQDDLARVAVELREISEGLRPPVLASFGLAAAVRALTQRLRTLYPAVDFDLRFEDTGTDLPEAPRLALYRIAQESLSNALKHGDPTTIRVQYERFVQEGAALTIEDDGAGFTVPDSLDAFETDGHLGLSGMAERAESIGSTLQVQSRPGRTRLSVRIPGTAFPSTDS